MDLSKLIALPADIDFEVVSASGYTEATESLWSRYLTDEEQVRRKSFKSPRRRLTFTMGRVAARRLLSRRLAIPETAVNLVIHESGAVDVDGFDGFLSITHTDETAVAAVSGQPIGIDIESHAERADDLYKYVLTESQYPLLGRSGLDRNSTVLICWVVKEAVVKGMRTGLRTSPAELDIELDFTTGIGRVFVTDGSEWAIRYCRSDNNHFACAFPVERELKRHSLT